MIYLTIKDLLDDVQVQKGEKFQIITLIYGIRSRELHLQSTQML